MDMGKVDYASRTVPTGYYCTHCGARGVKLWRDYNTSADAVDLKCSVCHAPDKVWDPAKGDQFAGLVPAVPTENGTTFWGYTSVPSAGVAWWWRLPPHPEKRAVVPEVPHPEPPDLASEVEYLVRASSTETSALWREWHRAVDWEQVSPGFWTQIGAGHGINGDELPVCVSVFYNRIDGHLVAFYEGTSALVDYFAIEKWTHKMFPNARGTSDALNFHNCLGALLVTGWEHKECKTCKVEQIWRDPKITEAGRAACKKRGAQ